MSTAELLRGALGLGRGEAPFRWQERLLDELVAGRIPTALDLPTGLGKTSVMALWLLARAAGAPLPRRLIYVVDRRAVVDQATEVALGLRAFVEAEPTLKPGLGLDRTQGLPISTLRGQHVDNRRWLEDPASAAIIVGTVDMVGSRLLFEGYGVGRKMRPYHAGLLGADALLVLDEAHLVPPFERLIASVARERERYGPASESGRRVVPPLRLLSLSATGRKVEGAPFSLADDEVTGLVKKRLDATKRLTVEELAPDDKLVERLALTAIQLSELGAGARCIVFCTSRDDADRVAAELVSRARRAGQDEPDVELLVGGRRVREREDAARRLQALGFIAGRKTARDTPAFLVATAAGEVGVDLDADHMVSDLVAWERMVQRLGRVNRRGEGAAEVRVLVPRLDDKTKAEEAVRVTSWRAAIEALPASAIDGGIARRDASSGALRELKRRSASDPDLAATLVAATTPAPLHPPLSRPLVEAWAMTSLERHAGRPIVAPWLRGWVEDEAQTTLAWRSFLPRRVDGRALSAREVAAFFDAAPVHVSEMLELETYRVLSWLLARATAVPLHEQAAAVGVADESGPVKPSLGPDDVVVFVCSDAGQWEGALRLRDLRPPKGDARAKDELERRLQRKTLVVDARLGGLSPRGLLDDDEGSATVAADAGGAWLDGVDGAAIVGFSVREVVLADDGVAPASERESLRLVTERAADGGARRCLVVERAGQETPSEDARALTRHVQGLAEHQAWAEARARSLAARLGIDPALSDALALAARLHDEGKRAVRWQEAFNAPRDGRVYAKTRGPIDQARLGGYRHELGSYLDALRHPDVRALPPELADLVLHLIVSHHGFARPVIALAGLDRPPSLLARDAQAIAERYARLTERWGPWGLAWWEAVLRAADQQASRDNDAGAFGGSVGEGS